MSENNLHQLFSRVVAAPPSDTTDIDAAIRVGRRQRHRRTVALALSAAAVVAVAGITVAWITVAGHAGRRPPAAVSPASAGRPVTDAHQLLGTWRATELDGKDVRGVVGFGSQPLSVTFSVSDKQWIWGANSAGAGHGYSGAFSVTAQGRFEGGKRVGVTANGYAGTQSEDPANPDAVRHATEARIVDATQAGPTKLLLLNDGRILGVYVKIARN